MTVGLPMQYAKNGIGDLTFRFKEVTQLLDTIIETQPKQSGSTAGGKTREEIVNEKCQELFETVPEDYIEDDYEEKIASQGGYQVPLNKACCRG